MSKNFNENTLFALPYRLNSFDYIFISKEFAKERIFSLVESHHPSNLAECAQILDEYYGVTDAQSMLRAIDAYDGSDSVDVVLALFYKAFCELGVKFAELNFSQFSQTYLQHDAIAKVAQTFFADMSQNKYEYIDKIETYARFYFGELADEDGKNSDNLIPNITEFFVQTSELYGLVKTQGVSAFNYARVIHIITLSYAVGYIDRGEFEHILGIYAGSIKQIFSGWDEYIASVLLGTAFLNLDDLPQSASQRESFFVNAIKDRANAVYVALNSPYDMFKESGIWSENLENSRAKISEILKKYINTSEYEQGKKDMSSLKDELTQTVQEAGYDMKIYERTLDEYYVNFHHILKDGAAEFLFNLPESNFIFTPLHEMSDEYSFYGAAGDFLNKTKVKLGSDEYPLMVILDSNLTLFTNKGIYIYSGMMFFKKAKFYAYKDVNFKIGVGFLGSLRCFVDGKEYFDIDLDEYEKITGKKSGTEESENLKIFSTEIDALTRAFEQIKKKFS